MSVPALYIAKECVKDYNIYYMKNGAWTLLLSEIGNYQRFRIHQFSSINTPKLKLEILATNGDPSARVYEMRAYSEEIS